LNNAVW